MQAAVAAMEVPPAPLPEPAGRFLDGYDQDSAAFGLTSRTADLADAEVERYLSMTDGLTTRRTVSDYNLLRLSGSPSYDDELVINHYADMQRNLAQGGAPVTRTGPNGSYEEWDTTNPDEDEQADEISRLCAHARSLFGTSPLVDTGSGTASYGPSDPGTWGQRTRGPSFSGYGA
jgi:hypothetical protein